MFYIRSYEKCNISNIYIKFGNGKYFDEYSKYDYLISINNINYIDDYTFELEYNICDNKINNYIIELFIFNKLNNNEYFIVKLSKDLFKNIYTSTFKLLLDNNLLINKIPKIIHQSYKLNKLNYNNHKACSSWRNMNINYQYKYWNDTDVYNLIKDNFSNDVLQAYNMLYAGAYKSDIFRLCVLYLEGGIWTDISSICEVPIDNIIKNENPDLDLIICKDLPSQIVNPNIYQAFIVTIPKNDIIKYILELTVDRVINNKHYEIEYPWLKNEGIGITGPAVFAIALNKYLNRPVRNLINDDFININNYLIKLIKHPGKVILNNCEEIITTKYYNASDDRYNAHYSKLLEKGYIYKNKVNDSITNIDNPYLFQIWIQSNYVSEYMYDAINSWKNKHLNFNYELVTDSKFIEYIKNDNEFPNLLIAYKKIKPYAYKSDIIRLYMLYKKGGIYADIDSVCYNSLENIYYDHDLVVCRDINNNNILNSIICSKKRNQFFKILINKIINNIINDNINDFKTDLDITGPKVFGDIFSEYFNINKPFPVGNFILNNEKVEILNYTFNLPLPEGSWIDSCKDYKVIKGNILETSARTISGNYIYNLIRFTPNDQVYNDNGILKNNTNMEYIECDGSGLIYSEKTKLLYINTKYPKYNEERLILDGNDFSKMFINNDIFN